MNNHSINKKIRALEYLWLGLYAFAGFSLELIVAFLVNTLGLPPLNKALNSLITGTLWFAFAIMLTLYAKKKFDFNIFSIKHKLTAKDYLITLVLVIIITIITFFGFHGFKPLMEFNNGSQGSIITYLLQVYYYLGESSLIVLSIAFGQQFLEQQFHLHPRIPSGGIFLALTWGLMHFLLQGLNGGLFTIVFSIFAGIIYVVCKKDIKYSYIFIALAFIL